MPDGFAWPNDDQLWLPMQTDPLVGVRAALGASRGASSLKIGRISRALIVFEIALSCGLLVAAGLMIKSVKKTRNMDTGFEMASVFTPRVGFPSALPGAQQGLDGDRFSLEGATYANDRERPRTRWASVTPGFFSALDIPLRQGRLIEASDRLEALQVAVVTERFVEQHLGGGDPADAFPAVAFRPFALTGTLACLLPARRATQVDRSDAMRSE